MGVPATNRRYRIFAGDHVAERWACADMLGLLTQLGAVAPRG